jgi:hypothetical protein
MIIVCLRIGQIHLNSSGMTVRWTYNTQADTTVNVGISNTASSGYAQSTLTAIANNSIGTNSGYTSGPGETLLYADGHMYYQQYENNGGDGCPPWLFKTQVDHAAGDSFPGTIPPSANPYLGCAGFDPNGFATVASNGGNFDSDRAQGYTEGAGVTFFGVSLGATTGFTSDIHHDYQNGTNGNQYVCGNAPMPNVPIIYSGSI